MSTEEFNDQRVAFLRLARRELSLHDPLERPEKEYSFLSPVESVAVRALDWKLNSFGRVEK